MKRLRFSLRVKLALVLLALAALPLAGILYVNEVERFLLQEQEQSLLAVARAVATALHERPQLLASASGATTRSTPSCSACSARPRGSGWWTAATRSSPRPEPAAGDRGASEAPWWQPLVRFRSAG